MKYILAGLLMLCLSLPAFAEDCDMSAVAGLTDKQKSELEVNCLKLKQINAVADRGLTERVKSVATKENLSEFGKVSRDFALAIGIAAKELGVAANDFLDTPAGKLTAVFIIWKVMGDDLIGVTSAIAGGIIGIFLLLLLWFLIIRYVDVLLERSVTYEDRAAFWGLYKYRAKQKIANGDPSGDACFAAAVVQGAGVVVSGIIISNFLV